MDAGRIPARRLAAGLLIVSLLVIAVLSFAAWRTAFSLSLDRQGAAARAELGFLTAALEKDFNRYKLLAKALSQTGAIRRRALTELPGLQAEADEMLLRMAAVSGADEIRFMTLHTAADEPTRKAVDAAYQGAIGLSFDPRNQGTFLISAPVWISEDVFGAVVVRADADALEWSWRALPKVVFFTGLDGQIQLSSLPVLRQRQVGASLRDQDTGGDGATAGPRLVQFSAPEWPSMGFANDTALLLSRDVPVLDMRGYALIDPRPAARSAWLAAIAVATTLIALFLILAAVAQRRAAEQVRQRRDKRAKAELELRIADRTVELTAEIAERRSTETRLRAMQDELVQAGKLSALGQMAAGIAHEINQPLAAIRSFAENASVYLSRGRTEDVAGNLKEIADLTDRAARIIRNLRSFARNQTEEVTEISVADVVDDALSIMKARIRAEAAEIDWHRPETDHRAIGGAVRLQQVVVNLIANALDAQAGNAAPFVALNISTTPDHVILTVQDRGPGLAEDVRNRMFDPFFSTKSKGGEGLGLGLSISYGIMRGFGGSLAASNLPDGGAMMTATLRAVPAASKAA